jgi:hypothetical protein
MNKFALIILSLIASLASFGQVVATENGVFSSTFIDVNSDTAAGQEFNLIRIYRSSSFEAGFEDFKNDNMKFNDYVGWFGTNWGSNFETEATLIGDGSVLIRENGNGEIIWYRQENTDQRRLIFAVSQIMIAAQLAGWIDTPKDELKLRTNLIESGVFRALCWKILADLNFLEKAQMPDGMIVYNADKSEEVKVGRNGLVRKLKDREEYFNSHGALVRVISTDDELEITIDYDYQRQVEKISDNNGNHFGFSLNEQGRVIAIESNLLHDPVRYGYDILNLGLLNTSYTSTNMRMVYEYFQDYY